ncbi:hypothetical protein FOMPIDRAFT_95034 [Fomitopsis schrenkii]|uniref:Uncharacterized protein n=1 Tax=Fomitopsis schrenkii TaxID=2126942 RepID=S8DXM4_FOMSC|nr:hypothetical protein FOMPIDRAFT_95034 [Fomitopsis schrenkii]
MPDHPSVSASARRPPRSSARSRQVPDSKRQAREVAIWRPLPLSKDSVILGASYVTLLFVALEEPAGTLRKDATATLGDLVSYASETPPRPRSLTSIMVGNVGKISPQHYGRARLHFATSLDWRHTVTPKQGEAYVG